MVQRVWLLRWLSALRERFWFLPGVLIVGALTLAVLLHTLDPLSLWVPHYETRRAVAMAIAGAMLGVAATMFTIVIAVLALASSQFGPRLIRQFLRDGNAQLTLGIFLAVSSYQTVVAVLAQEQGGSAAFWGGLLLTGAALGMLVAFVESIAQSIHVDVVTHRVEDDLRNLLDALSGSSEPAAAPIARGPFTIGAPADGYLQAIDLGALPERAAELDLTVTVLARPGTHLLAGEPVLATTRPLDEPACDRLTDCLMIGVRRDTTQDPELLVEQLAEVGVRALSPGVNDPYTAQRCIHAIARSLRHHAACLPLTSVYEDREGVPRVQMRWPTFDEMLAAGLERLIHAARQDPPTLKGLLHALYALEDAIEDEPARAAVQELRVELASAAGGPLARLPFDRDARLTSETLLDA